MDNLMLRRRLMMAAQGVWTTVTATTPFSVQNALKSKMKSIIQYGKMVQDGTPTPSAPVYPTINNGTVQMVDDDLPAGYKRLKGITFGGNFHFRTGEALTGNDDVTMTLDNLSTSGKNVFGSYNGANGKNFSLYIYGSNTSGSYFRFGDVLKRPVYGGTGRRTITFGAGGTSGFAEDVSIGPDEFTTPANTYIGMLPNSSSAAYTGDIIGSIPVGTRLEWVPCESDGGVIGYYERVNGNFIAPTGSGTPVSLGYDTSHLVPRVVGDTETLTAVGNLLSRDGETTGKIITSDGTVSDNSNYCISAPFVLPAGNYTCTWQTGSGARPFSVFAVDESGTPLPDGKLFYQGTATAGINTGEFAVEAETLVVASYRSNATDLAIYSNTQTASVPDLFAVGNYRDEVDVVAGTVTRRVRMKVLTGEESVGLVSAANYYGRISVDDPRMATAARNQAVSTHFVWVEGTHPERTLGSVWCGWYGGEQYLYITPTDQTLNTSEKIKAFLAAQYAAGTPVIVWYPLAEPTTESITPQAFSTVKGSNVIDATSDIAPFDVSVTYRARK